MSTYSPRKNLNGQILIPCAVCGKECNPSCGWCGKHCRKHDSVAWALNDVRSIGEITYP